jgi:hypothetical protein
MLTRNSSVLVLLASLHLAGVAGLGRRKANAVVLLSALDDDYGWPHHRFDYSPPAPPAVTCRIGICTCGTWAESSSGRLIIVCGALCGVFVRRSGEGYRYIRMVIRCRWIAEA